MTIRNYIKMRAGFAAILGIGVMAVLARLSHLNGALYWPLVALCFVLTVLLVLMTKCPRCGFRLKAAVRGINRKPPTVNNCPGCGVSFDDSM